MPSKTDGEKYAFKTVVGRVEYCVTGLYAFCRIHPCHPKLAGSLRLFSSWKMRMSVYISV